MLWIKHKWAIPCSFCERLIPHKQFVHKHHAITSRDKKHWLASVSQLSQGTLPCRTVKCMEIIKIVSCQWPLKRTRSLRPPALTWQRCNPLTQTRLKKSESICSLWEVSQTTPYKLVHLILKRPKPVGQEKMLPKWKRESYITSIITLWDSVHFARVIGCKIALLHLNVSGSLWSNLKVWID